MNKEKTMTKRSMVVGMGIGQLYKAVLEGLGHEVVTVDSDIFKKADVPNVDAAIMAYGTFDTVHICTPNYTHATIAKLVAPYAKMVFIEKPGVSTSTVWSNLILRYPNTRFMMVKNNMWRDNIDTLREQASRATTIHLDWINKDRVPNPGTWFTTHDLAFGGVSRDLMPHLLSIFMALDPTYSKAQEVSRVVKQKWQLSDLTQTDYGVVKADGVYNVDDYCHLEFANNDKKWTLTADWRSGDQDKREIEFIMEDGTKESFELGLCPEDAYSRMIADAVANADNTEFWAKQLAQDLYIHMKVETI